MNCALIMQMKFVKYKRMKTEGLKMHTAPALFGRGCMRSKTENSCRVVKGSHDIYGASVLAGVTSSVGSVYSVHGLYINQGIELEPIIRR